MRMVAFVVCAIITTGLVMVLNMPLTINGSKTPLLGAFLSPQHGFWQNAEPANSNFSDRLKFSALHGKTDVYFDDRLVPHIYADNENDAYFVQGYLHAKFRLWQMEFQTHAAAGRLSEIMGDSSGGTSFVEVDKYFRRLGMVYGAEQSLKKLEEDPVTKGENDAYTAGVNAYISTLRPNQYPLEFKLLNYKPEKWTTLKSMLFLKYMSWNLAGSETDLEMTNAKSIFTPAEVEALYPVTSDSLDPIIPRGTLFAPPSVVAVPPASADSLYYNYHGDTGLPVYPKPATKNVIKPDKRNGSNNWAVNGSKTKSGAPILCNDPHLGLNLPSLWYEMQITTPEFSAYGVSFPGAPSIIIGFNDSCAWGVTNAGRDVKDYYEIEFRDSTMREYRYNGSWATTEFRDEIIKIRDKPSDTEHIAITVFGPVMYDKSYPNLLNDGKSYAIRWPPHDESNELMTYNRLDHAKNYIDFLRAIAANQCPGQNYIFAAKGGDIALRQQGRFPAKWRRQGDFVMPGIDSTYLWQGVIPSRENPTLFNPERGFVSSANQLAADKNYPYYLAGDLVPYRGIIINRRLQQMNNITIQDMMQMQTDNYNVFAEMAMPVLLKNIDTAKLTSSEQKYFSKLQNWNLRNDIGEEGPTIFTNWWDSLETAVYNDEFSRTPLPLKWPDQSTLLEGLLRDSVYLFTDNINTPETETIQDMVLASFKQACKEIKTADNERRLVWGRYKDTGVRHLLKLPAFSLMHLPIGGGTNTINAATADHGPGWRMIVQLTSETEAYGVFPGGQSGNPGSRYYDNFVDKWVKGEYYRLQFMNLTTASHSRYMKWHVTFSKA